jgi:hypothetical protein
VVDTGAAERIRAGRRAGGGVRQAPIQPAHVPGGAGRRGREEDPVTDQPDVAAVLADALDQLAAGIRRADPRGHLMDRCEDCAGRYCRECGSHYCAEPCACMRSHNCRCECDAHDRRMTYAD